MVRKMTCGLRLKHRFHWWIRARVTNRADLDSQRRDDNKRKARHWRRLVHDTRVRFPTGMWPLLPEITRFWRASWMTSKSISDGRLEPHPISQQILYELLQHANQDTEVEARTYEQNWGPSQMQSETGDAEAQTLGGPDSRWPTNCNTGRAIQGWIVGKQLLGCPRGHSHISKGKTSSIVDKSSRLELRKGKYYHLLLLYCLSQNISHRLKGYVIHDKFT